MLSSLLSIFVVFQKKKHSPTERYSEASKLNAQLESNLNKAIDLLRSEKASIRRRIAKACRTAEGQEVLLRHFEPPIRQLMSETERALASSDSSWRAIEESTRFYSKRKWEEYLSRLRTRVHISSLQLDRIERTIYSAHLAIENAEHNTLSRKLLDEAFEAFEKQEDDDLIID